MTMTVKQLLAANLVGSSHEGTLHGAQPRWDWYAEATYHVGQPSATFGHDLNVWAVVYRDSSGVTPPNVGVELANYRLYGLRAHDYVWVPLSHIGAPTGGEARGEGDFTKRLPLIPTRGAVGEIWVPPTAYNAHAWNGAPVDVAPAGTYLGFITAVSHRVVMLDPNGADHRNAARYLVDCGSDWTGSPNVLKREGTGCGRFVYARPWWRTACSSTFVQQTAVVNSPGVLPPTMPPVAAVASSGVAIN